MLRWSNNVAVAYLSYGFSSLTKVNWYRSSIKYLGNAAKQHHPLPRLRKTRPLSTAPRKGMRWYSLRTSRAAMWSVCQMLSPRTWGSAAGITETEDGWIELLTERRFNTFKSNEIVERSEVQSTRISDDYEEINGKVAGAAELHLGLLLDYGEEDWLTTCTICSRVSFRYEQWTQGSNSAASCRNLKL